MKSINPKTNLLEHSEAKIALYGRYLSVYLNILHRAGFVKRIFLFDFFCGEGMYENNAKGSPIIALDCIKDHYYSNRNLIPNMTVWFNDIGKSDFEDGYKVDRVKHIYDAMLIPSNVDVRFFKEDYRDIFPKAIELVKQTKDSKGLFFVDPFGYKKIKPFDIRQMLEVGDTEVLLWLPIAQMYRFAGSVMESRFSGSDSLREFLTELFGNDLPEFESAYDFVEQLRERFRTYLRDLNSYVDIFTLERDATNIYCLFFFTRNIKGYEKIIEAKWQIDKDHGKGFTLEKTPSLFSEIELSGYKQKVQVFVESAEYRTNEELYNFGLENGFLPKHTKSVLDNIDNVKIAVEVVSLDGKPAKGYYYLGDMKRRVGIRLIQKLGI
ncbi:MAG: three-Cys-motif partner protein TcmP [Anaerolineales bacterium]|nr:three-Cys-motif partner protein TcmP [Anaerolineales bacterium]